MKLIGTLTRRGLSIASFSRDGYDHWGGVSIQDVRTVAVERWLKQLSRVNGERLADATKAKIRNLMSVLFKSVEAPNASGLRKSWNPMSTAGESRWSLYLGACEISVSTSGFKIHLPVPLLW